MTSPLVPQRTMKFEGKEYTLRLDLNALSDFESMSGKSIMRGGLTDISQLELSDVRSLLWACLVQEDETLTMRDVGRMIHIGNLVEVTGVLRDLVTGAMPAAVEGEADESPLTPTSPSAIANGGLDTGPQQSPTSE